MENLLYKLQLQVSHSYLSEGGPTINLKFIYLFIYLFIIYSKIVPFGTQVLNNYFIFQISLWQLKIISEKVLLSMCRDGWSRVKNLQNVWNFPPFKANGAIQSIRNRVPNRIRGATNFQKHFGQYPNKCAPTKSWKITPYLVLFSLSLLVWNLGFINVWREV